MIGASSKNGKVYGIRSNSVSQDKDLDYALDIDFRPNQH